jgi:arginyl-tRNA synthetase
MKQIIENALYNVITKLKSDNIIPADQNIKIMVEKTKDKVHGDFSTNLAMLLTKVLKKKPLDIAQQIIDNLELTSQIDKVEIAGVGFINFFINIKHIEEKVNQMLNSPKLGVNYDKDVETIVIDYSSPNVAKEMAVHHIRSTVIGDSVVRILEFLGNNVIRANHIGDWGTQFGMLIAFLEKQEKANVSTVELSDLEAFYREAKICYDNDEEFATKARQYVVKLQSGDEYCLEMWKKLVNITMQQNQDIYNRLNVSLTPKDVMGESLYNPMLHPLVDDLKSKNLAVLDDGAYVVYLDSFKDKEGNPRGVIVQKKDGGFLYTTTDVACAKYRCEHFHANRIIIFADSRQHEHLLMAWDIARKAGYIPDNVSLEHGSFGMMLGKDGKPFKTRSGGTVKLKDLLNEAITRVSTIIEERKSDLDEETKKDVIDAIAMGAIKYADLSKNRTTDYVFDWDNMLTFDGNTAPYLQYAYSRIQSIFKKSENIEFSNIKIEHECEELIANKALQFNSVINSCAEKAMPHLLCTYLFELAGLFMKFYEACPINKDGVDINTRNSRLSICKLTSNIIKTGLDLLGIRTIERM